MQYLIAFSDPSDSIVLCHFSQQCPDRSLQNKQRRIVREIPLVSLLLPRVCLWTMTTMVHHPSPSFQDCARNSADAEKDLMQGVCKLVTTSGF